MSEGKGDPDTYRSVGMCQSGLDPLHCSKPAFYAMQEPGELQPGGAEGPAGAGHAELLVQELALQEGAGQGGGRSRPGLPGSARHRLRGIG